MDARQQFTTGEHTFDEQGAPAARRSGARRLLAPLAAVALIGFASAGTVAHAASGSTAKAATPTCATSGLSASLGKGLAGGMMHQGTVLKLKNTTGHTCDLRGYPGLGLEGAQHDTLSSKTFWGDTYYAKDPGKKTLTLKAGQSAEAVIAWSHANTGTKDAQHARYLVVTPPASKTHKTLKLDTWVDNGALSVTPVAYTYKVTG